MPAVAPSAAQKRPSPSPSIKRGKAEKLLKEHGSPPGMRVTAGGRIVPSDLPPLGTSRFSDNTYKPQTFPVAPGNVMSAPPQPNSNDTARIEVIGGQPVVFIGDRMFALPAVNTVDTAMPSASVAAMDSTIRQTPDPAVLTTHRTQSRASFVPTRASTQTPFAGFDLPALKAQQALKKQELRSVEQTEVLQASHQSDSWRASIIEKKRCLIVELDTLRKQITSCETDNSTSISVKPFHGSTGEGESATSVPLLVPQFQQPPSQAMYTFPAANPYAPMMIYQPPFSAFSAFSAPEPAPVVPNQTNAPHSPGSGSRRSHAVEIKPPREEPKKQAVSALDPKSPTYEPIFKSSSTQNIAPPTPSPPKRSPWQGQQMTRPDKHEPRGLSQQPSLSSIDTTDFFPTNTHEHSSTRVAPRVKDAEQASNENMAVSSSPEKHWPASPWNGDHSGRFRNNEPSSKLTSWPEAFGKQPSISSLRQHASSQTLGFMLERAPIMDGQTASNNNMVLRTNADQRTGTEENWPFLGKRVAHMLSTYQEGYQAGYDHVGIPDSPEVLQGYIQGLVHFLSDESKKRQQESAARELFARSIDSRTPSLRGLVAGSTPHDTAVTVTSNRHNPPNGNQENTRSANGNLAANNRRDSAYSPQRPVRNIQAPHALCNEAIQQLRQRDALDMKFLSPPGLLPDRVVSGPRQHVFPCLENDIGKKAQESGSPPSTESFSNNIAPQQTFGNQLQNRNYGTPLSMQRFFPTFKEVSRGGFGRDDAPPQHVAENRVSGLDGAMDDLAEMINDTHVEDSHVSGGQRPTETPIPADVEELTASCFKPSGGKGKQKVLSSPAKPASSGKNDAISSPVNLPSSPKKSGEHSPAKVKLDQVTNKFRRVKKDDPRGMSPEDRTKRSEKWRQRFQQLKRSELEEIAAYNKNYRT